jgi:hypothetical protein
LYAFTNYVQHKKLLPSSISLTSFQSQKNASAAGVPKTLTH